MALMKSASRPKAVVTGPGSSSVIVRRPNASLSKVMDEEVPPITTSMTLSEVAARFAESDLERLPVVDERKRLAGAISKKDVLKHGRF